MTNSFSYISGFWNIEVKKPTSLSILFEENGIKRWIQEVFNQESYQILIRYKVQIIKIVKFWHDKLFFIFFRLLKYWGKIANKSFNFIWRKWNKLINPRSFQPRILSILIRYNVQMIKTVKFWHDKLFFIFFRLLKYWGKKSQQVFQFYFKKME